jgi:photosystem II stability/assembly factor-like uncharacterized protein
LPEIAFDLRQDLHDIVQVDDSIVLAVGDGGLIVRGTRDLGGEWSWRKMPTLTKNSLTSVAFDNSGRLWVVGNHGTLLTSDTQGTSWAIEEVGDQTDAVVRSNFFRIRVWGDAVWILGDGVVLKSTRS